jgi:hypothetical protein
MDVESLLHIMDEHDIVHSVVFSFRNELTLNAVKNHPDRFTGLVWVNPLTGEKAVNKIREGCKEWGFRGIKLHPLMDAYLPDSEIVHPVMEQAEKFKIPVLFHCGHPPWSLPWHFENLADRFSEVPIILGHMGHGHIVYINGAISVAQKFDNVYLETSGMPMHTKIKEAVDKVGLNKVLYGSDAPFGHPAFELKKVEVSGLKKHEISRVLGENAQELFKLRI